MTLRRCAFASSLFTARDGSHQLQASNSRTRDCYGVEATRGRSSEQIAVKSALCPAVRCPAPFFLADSLGATPPATRDDAGGTLRAIH